METCYHILLFLLSLTSLNLEQILFASGGLHSEKTENVGPDNFVIGAIVDYSTRVGKEDIVAMELAAEDYYNQTNKQLILLLKNSQGVAVQAILAARYLIKERQVQAILGPRSWEETSVIAEVGSEYGIPVLSLADYCPPWATSRWPFLIQASPSKYLQMKSVAAVIQSWGWRRVNVIYEDIDSAANGITPHLYDALQEVGTQISHLTALPSLANDSLLSQELHKLKADQCRVFIAHVSLDLAVQLFNLAKKMKMMEQGYVWITTDSTTSLIHSLDISTISSMQGVLGVKSYNADKGMKYQDFFRRFHDKFRLKYPEEKNQEPGNSALEAYDGVWTVALAMEEGNINPQHLLAKLSNSSVNGISGEIQFVERRLAPINVYVFQIINVIGRSYLEPGFWTDGRGFSVTFNGTAKNSDSMGILGQVFWPGGSPATPRGWDIPTVANPLRIGVPNGSLIKNFVDVEYDSSTGTYTISGFSIDVFREAVKLLPYYLPYRFIPFDDTYDDLVQQVQLQNFDAAVGDIAIISKRYAFADFTHPHTESGLVLVVPIQSQSNKGWLFLKPFTKPMWLLTVAITVYNGFVIWMIERNYCSELKGSALNQIGKLLWLAFATLFSVHGDKLHSNLSKVATLVWLFVALIISQTYTANLTSLLTVSRLEPKVANSETLRNNNQVIGYSRKGSVKGYLLDVLHFNPNNIRHFATLEECAESLKTGKTAGALLEVPTAKLFLAKYCKSFMTTGPTYKYGGYGYVILLPFLLKLLIFVFNLFDLYYSVSIYQGHSASYKGHKFGSHEHDDTFLSQAFPKGSPLVADIDEALLKVFEKGTLKELEDKLTASENCVDSESEHETLSLSASSFFVLFLFTGGTSTAALAIYAFHSKCKVENSMSEHERIWMLIVMVLKHSRKQKIRFSRKFTSAGTSTSFPTPWY